MWPIGPLMHEHRLIERMIALAEAEAGRLRAGGEADPAFVDQAADFIRTYADRCHHGKEEDILFSELAERDLSAGLAKLMAELIEDHKYGRALVGQLVEANRRQRAGEAGAKDDVAGCLEELAEFYPRHIAKEDDDFFFPCMDLFSKEERDAMLERFYEFDRRLIHERYGLVVERLEEAGSRAG